MAHAWDLNTGQARPDDAFLERDLQNFPLQSKGKENIMR